MVDGITHALNNCTAEQLDKADIVDLSNSDLSACQVLLGMLYPKAGIMVK